MRNNQSLGPQPLVSIVTPCYNADRFIEATMASVQAQTYTNWVHLLVLDKKTKDKTRELILERAKKDTRVKLIESDQANGAAQCRNLALAEARGEFVAFLDADDLWLPEKLEKQVAFMDAQKIDFSYAAYKRMSIDGQTHGRVLEVSKELSYEGLLRNNEIGCLTVMLRRSACPSLNFQEQGWEDMSAWLSILKTGKRAYGLNEPLALYRIVPGSRSNNKIFAARMRWDTFRQVEKMGLLRSAYYFSHFAVSAALKYARF